MEACWSSRPCAHTFTHPRHDNCCSSSGRSQTNGARNLCPSFGMACAVPDDCCVSSMARHRKRAAGSFTLRSIFVRCWPMWVQKSAPERQVCCSSVRSDPMHKSDSSRGSKHRLSALVCLLYPALAAWICMPGPACPRAWACHGWAERIYSDPIGLDVVDIACIPIAMWISMWTIVRKDVNELCIRPVKNK